MEVYSSIFNSLLYFVSTRVCFLFLFFYYRYTSIGTKKNTIKNEALLQDDGTYLHASCLTDWSLERGIRKEVRSCHVASYF